MSKIRRILTRSALTVLTASAAAFYAGQGLAWGAGEWKDSQMIYNKVCAYCHDTGIGPVLMGRDLPTEYFELVARNGLAAMPSFTEADISNAELRALAEALAAGEIEGRSEAGQQ